MEKKIAFLQKAKDFKVITVKTHEFMLHRFDGLEEFEKEVPQEVFAYGTEWECRLEWTDSARGHHAFLYRPKGRVFLPEKIHIETEWAKAGPYTNTKETLYFYGEKIASQNDDYGRRKGFKSFELYRKKIEKFKTAEEAKAFFR